MDCISCGKSFSRITQHWAMSQCNYPKINDIQHEIIVGGLMGDMTAHRPTANTRIQCKMINKKYLDYIDNVFDNISSNIWLSQTASEKAEEDIRSGFNSSANSSNYSDVYSWNTICHPKLNKYQSWYDSGSKVWPNDIVLSPTTLKHWYCCDGNRDSRGSHNNISIGVSNERKNTDKISKLFSNVDLPSPNNYKNTKRNDGSVNCVAQFTKDQSKILWEYMGDPLPGFEYKWS